MALPDGLDPLTIDDLRWQSLSWEQRLDVIAAKRAAAMRPQQQTSTASSSGSDDAAVERLHARTRRDRATLADAAAVQATILLEFERRIQEIRSDQVHRESWLTQREAQLREEAARAWEDAEASARDALAALQAQGEAAVTPKPGSVAEQQLLEQRIATSWIGLSMLLQTAAADKNPITAIQAAAESTARDPARLEALKRFGDDWLAVNIANNPNHSPEVKEGIVGALHTGVEVAAASLRTPVQAAGHELLQTVAGAQARLAQNGASARGALAYEDKRKPAVAMIDLVGDNHAWLRDHRGRELPAETVAAGLGEPSKAWQASARRTYPVLATPVTEVMF